MSMFYFCGNCNRKYKTKNKLIKHASDKHNILLDENTLFSKPLPIKSKPNKKSRRIPFKTPDTESLADAKYNKNIKQREQHLEFLEKEIERKNKDPSLNTNLKMCPICLDKQVNAIFIPCGHISCCIDCSYIIKNNNSPCPICRQDITSINQIFISI